MYFNIQTLGCKCIHISVTRKVVLGHSTRTVEHDIRLELQTKNIFINKCYAVRQINVTHVLLKNRK